MRDLAGVEELHAHTLGDGHERQGAELPAELGRERVPLRRAQDRVGESASLDDLFGRVRFVDAFRTVNADPDQYTWWSNRGQARAKNVGWRIDYQVVSAALARKVQRASIYTQSRFSDHAPLILDYDHVL